MFGIIGTGCYDKIKIKNEPYFRFRAFYRDAKGAKKQKVIYALKLTTLKLKVEKWQLEMSHGKIADMSVKLWVEQWLNLCRSSNKVKTIQNYETCASNHILKACDGLKLSEVTPLLLQDYFNGLLVHLSASTVISIRRIFIVCFNAAINFGYLVGNPAKRTKPPRKPLNKAKALTKAESKAFLDVLKDSKYLKKENLNEAEVYLRDCYLMAVKLALATGMREGEVFGLRWNSVIKSKTIRIESTLSAAKGKAKLDTPKTQGSKRNIKVPDTVFDDLMKWKDEQIKFAKRFNGIFENENNLVFTNSTGKPLNVSNFMHRCFYPAVKAAGLDGVNFHTLRHTHASQLLEAGVNIQVVSKRLGHSSVSTTMNIYAHLLPSLDETAVNVLNQIFDD